MESKKQVKAQAKKSGKKAAKKQLKKLGLGKGMRGHRKALASSHYFASVCDPWNAPGAQIPDENVVPTFTMQAVTRFTSAAVAGSGAGASTVGIGFHRVCGATVGAASGALQFIAPSATANLYSSSSTLAYGPFAQFTNFASARLVSAGLYVTYQGAPNTCTGRMILAYLPGPYWYASMANLNPTTGYNTVTLLGAPNVVDIPMSRGFGMVRYLPSDPLSLSYEPSGTVAYGTVRQGGAGAYATYGVLACICDGLPAGGSVEFTLVENYELIPASGNVNLFSPTPSLSDPLEMAASRNAIASTPTLAIAQDAADTVTGTAFKPVSVNARPEVEPPASMLDSVLGGVGKVVDAAAGWAPKVAPLVASVLAAL